jgi:16S rRNA (cytidine1402-2'-O)-methyltransferase
MGKSPLQIGYIQVYHWPANKATCYTYIMTSYGKLTLGAVPIGDPGDASINLIKQIVSHKIILVETPDVFYKLCKDLDISTQAKIIDYGSHETPEDTESYINILKSGQDILVLSDEGTAGLIDPGGVLLDVARQNGIKVKVMSGPNSIVPTIVLSRFDKRFLFYGPAKNKEDRRESFKTMSNYDFPIVFFVTRDYMEDFFLDAVEFFEPNRRVFLCSNLTQPNEFTIFTTLYGAFEHIQDGKLYLSTTIVIDGKPPH